MAKIKYYYDTETCKYERVKTKTSDIVLNALGILAFIMIAAAGLMILYINYFPSPKTIVQENKLAEQQFFISKLSRDVENLDAILQGIEKRDDNIYRVVLGAEPIDSSIRKAGAGGSDRYADIREKDIINEDMVIELNKKVDMLRRKLYIESKSQDEVVQLDEDVGVAQRRNGCGIEQLLFASFDIAHHQRVSGVLQLFLQQARSAEFPDCDV